MSFSIIATAEIPVPTPEQLAWQKMELTMFVHYGINTYTDSEWGHGNEDPKLFNPSQLDCRQWVQAAKASGFKLMILTAKHHDGFCLWPSKYTDHSVKNSPWKDGKGDVVKEFTDACREAGMKVGLYLSPWDRNNKTYGTDEYNDYFVKQLEELLTQYGPVDEMWFDGACGEGSNGKKQVYDWKRYFDTIKKHAPRALTAVCGQDIRWVGNESGVARVGESSVKDAIPNMHFGKTGKVWYPAECDVSIRPGWFYHAGQDRQVKSLEHLMNIYMQSVGRNSVLLLNVPPDKRGLFADPDLERLDEFGAAVRDLYKDDLMKQAKVQKSDDGIELSFEKPVVFNLINIEEDISKGERVREYKVQVFSDGSWTDVAGGTVIGNRNLIGTGETVTDKVRVKVLDSVAAPLISGFSIHKVQAVGNRGSGSLSAHKPAEASNVHPGGTEFGGDKAVDDDMATRWATSDDTRECWLEVDLLSQQTIGSVGISELDPRIKKFKIEYRNSKDAEWSVAYEGTDAGTKFKTKLQQQVQARYVRLHILEATKAPTISEFQVFGK